jgi:hypothetical protein
MRRRSPSDMRETRTRWPPRSPLLYAGEFWGDVHDDGFGLVGR